MEVTSVSGAQPLMRSNPAKIQLPRRRKGDTFSSFPAIIMYLPPNDLRQSLASRMRRRNRSPWAQSCFDSLECRRLLASAFYVAEAGDDGADGLSPQTAWRSV